MTAPARREPYEGRHRPTTVPTYWDRPGERRHLVGTPGFDWATVPEHLQVLAPPTPPVLPPSEGGPGIDTTGEFSVAALRADWDPTPTGPLHLWEDSGPLPIIPPPRDDDPPSMAWGWAIGFYLLAAIAAALLTVALAPVT